MSGNDGGLGGKGVLEVSGPWNGNFEKYRIWVPHVGHLRKMVILRERSFDLERMENRKD